MLGIVFLAVLEGINNQRAWLRTPSGKGLGGPIAIGYITSPDLFEKGINGTATQSITIEVININ